MSLADNSQSQSDDHGEDSQETLSLCLEMMMMFSYVVYYRGVLQHCSWLMPSSIHSAVRGEVEGSAPAVNCGEMISFIR